LKKELASHKRAFLGILISVRKNRVSLMSSFDNDALHDLRVALRRVQAIDSLCKGSIGICMNEEVQEGIKKVLKVSSNLRDIEELSSHTGFSSGALLEQKERLLAQFLESVRADIELTVFVEYAKIYAFLKTIEPKIGEMKLGALKWQLDLLKKNIKKLSRMRFDFEADFKTLHSIRKKFKKIRYSLDFLFLGASEGAFVCKELQDRLGKINDLRVWMGLLKREGVWMDGLKEQLMAHLLEAKAESGAFGSKEYLQMICKNMSDKMILSGS